MPARVDLSRSARHPRCGLTLTEMMIASVVTVLVMFVGLGVVVRDSRLSRSTMAIAVAETHAQTMMRSLVRRLSDARGEVPFTHLSADLGAADTSLVAVDSTLGFPDEGLLLVDRGTGGVEQILYASLGNGGGSFRTLGRGAECTAATAHSLGGEVHWACIAQVVDLAGSPPASAFDGRAVEPEGTVHFIGDGTGFSYRLPTDPAGGDEVLDGSDIRWGAIAGGTPTLAGWSALVWSPRDSLDEAQVHLDVNRDGDETDVFDVGQIRVRAWDTANTAAPVTDTGIGPVVILQERCNRGGDLDGDGFEDPIFLWDPALRRLHVRLFVLGRSGGEVPAVRRVDTMVFLRNEVGT